MSQEDVARPTWMPEAGMHTAASAPNLIKNRYILAALNFFVS